MIYRVFKAPEPDVQMGEVSSAALKGLGDKISLTVGDKESTFTIMKISRPLLVERKIVTDAWVKELDA